MRIGTLVATVGALFVSVTHAQNWNPQADERAIVSSGEVRFTVLNPRLIRMEWSPTASFEDRASLVVVNRQLDVPRFVHGVNDGWLEIETEDLQLRYRVDSGPFSRSNLEITSSRFDGVWTSGKEHSQNLGGTFRTLDGVSGRTALEPGLLARDGWTLLDDSQRHVFTNEAWPWVEVRPESEAIDWYFFAYGTHYIQVLQDFVSIAGRIPLPPRYAFGAWWSRYWDYTEDELRQLVAEFREHDVPLDVLVIDMDWHLDGWTGYTWDTKKFPDPEGFLQWTQAEGLKVPLNLHPADGVGKHEAAFEDVARAMGVDFEEVERITFQCTNRDYVDAYFEYLHHPLERQGIDFWWIDWQQGTESGVPGLDPLWWLNYLHWEDWSHDPAKKDRRPLLFSRWGGLGNHRYQVGFSGDTFSDWASLAFQPDFTATAGNVGYGYWSHDIGGHQPGPVDAELYARWIQWGAFSPILRTHTTKNPRAERRIWAFDDETYRVSREAWLLRYSLIPYIYTMARKTYDEAIPLCRPLYYHWPDLEEAYSHPGQYMFGDDLLVAPIAEPVDSTTQCTSVKVWLPPGRWTNWFTGRHYEGPMEARLVVPLEEFPVFVRDGAVIPTMPKMNYSDEKPIDPLILNIFGGESGTLRLYEDDGRGIGYRSDNWATTPISYSRDELERCRVDIGGIQGQYVGMQDRRGYEIRLYDVSLNPRSVKVDGNRVEDSATPSGDGWRHAPEITGAIITVAPRLVTSHVTVEFQRSPSRLHIPREGTRGRLQTIRAIKRMTGFDPIKEADQLSTPDKHHYYARLWQLYAHLNVKQSADTHELEASVEAAIADEEFQNEDTKLSVSFRPPTNWRVRPHLGERLDVPGSMDGVVARCTLMRDGPLQTAVLTADIKVEGRLNHIFPLRKVLLPSINAWWVAGPFERGDFEELDKEFSKLTKMDAEHAFKGKAGADVGWRRVEREIRLNDNLTDEFFVNLTDVFGKRVYEAGIYAVVYLESPSARGAQLAIGSDDGVVVWLNHEEVHRNIVGRAYASKQDIVPITLKQGINILTIRVGQYGGDWGFGVHLQTPDGEPMTDVMVKLDPEVETN